METVHPRDDWEYWKPPLFFDGCACAEGHVETTYVETHCHRTSLPIGDSTCDCQYAGVHYRGDIEAARKMADYIANAYHCQVDIVNLEEA